MAATSPATTPPHLHTTGGLESSPGEQGEQQVRLEPQKVRFFFLSFFCLLMNNISTLARRASQRSPPRPTCNTSKRHPHSTKKGPNDSLYRRFGLDMPSTGATSPRRPQNTTNGGSSTVSSPYWYVFLFLLAFLTFTNYYNS